MDFFPDFPSNQAFYIYSIIRLYTVESLCRLSWYKSL